MKERNKNSGFSLIELVVALAIMGAVAMFSVSIYSSVNSADVESAALNIDSMLSVLRSETLTKANEFELRVEKASNGDYEVRLYEKNQITDAAGVVTYEWKVVKSENIGQKVEIVALSKSDISYSLTTSCGFSATCSKSNGSYTSLICRDASGNLVSGSGDDITRLVITKGKHKDIVKMIVPTGRHYVE